MGEVLELPRRPLCTVCDFPHKEGREPRHWFALGFTAGVLTATRGSPVSLCEMCQHLVDDFLARFGIERHRERKAPPPEGA